MSRKHIFISAIACMAAFCVCGVRADAEDGVWWVSRNGGDDVNGTGKSNAPFESIQRAVNAASAGDTIKIRAGIYDQGEHWDGSQTNRVLITKKLTLEGVDGKDVTHIVGRYQPGATADEKSKMGAAAIRCIRIKDLTAAGTIIKNLTIRDGAAQNSGDAVQSWGGGVCGYEKGRTAFYLVDCVVSNCAACWGGAFHGGAAVRCLLKGNWGVGPGNSVRYGNMVNCLVVNSKNYNTSARSALAFGTFVNCTVASCVGGGIGFSGYVYNSIAFNTTSTEIWAVGSAYSGGDNYVVTNSYKSANAPHLLFSPATGDYRLTAGTPAVGGGLTEFLKKVSLPEGIDPYIDLAGNTIDSSVEKCDAGCFQGSKVPAAGRIAFSTAFEVEGVSNLFGRATCYYTPETWPMTVRARQLSVGPEKYMCATVEGFHANTFRRIYPLMDGTHLIVPPPFTNETTTLTAKAADMVVYAAPSGDAETADGTVGNPIPTLQGAVDYAVANTSEGASIMILAKPGTYDEGGVTVRSVFTRLSLPDTRYWLVKGIEGAGATTIKGHVDEDSTQPNAQYYLGCGSNAVRCVSISPRTVSKITYPTAVQGFTLTDGRTHCETTADNDAHRGAGVIGTSTPNCQLLDCIVTNCWAERCTVSYNAGLFRCKVYDCHGYGGVMRYTRIISSYVDPSCTLGGHPSGVSANCILGNSTYALLCTAPNVDVWNDDWCFSTLSGNLSPRAAIKLFGSACTNSIGNSSTGYVTIPEMNFADPENGDWRLRETSRARFEVVLPEKGTPEYGQWATNFALNVCGDVDGNPISVIDGKPMPGCWHTTAGDKSLFIAADKAGLTVTGGALGDNAGVDGLSVSVAVGSGSRPCIGVLVNGETNLFSDAATYTYTAADVAASEHGITVSAVYSPHWYVNPGDLGDDDLNNGFSPQTPKKTLARVLPLAVLGDTVHAAAGKYEIGEMTDTSGYGSKARAVIKGGITLVSDEGPESTFIVGGPDTESDPSLLDPYGYGMGSNAVRAVYMENQARLVGFTVTGGRSWYLDATDYSVPWSGGGIEGVSNRRSTIYVEDSVISNNYAVYGGGVRYVTLIRCKVFENHATQNGGALRDSHAYGTVFNRNYSGTTQTDRSSCHEYTGLVGCTLGPENYNMEGVTVRAFNGASSNQAHFHDNLVLGVSGVKGNLTNTVTGCVFADSCNNMPTNGTCIVVPSSELQVDENLRPIVGRNAAVDAGSPEALTEHTSGLLPLDVDALGFMRVMNGRIDVGALEGDWRPMYAKILDGKGTYLKVMAVDSGTVTNDVDGVASVELHGGEALELVWGTVALPAARRGKVRVAGEGTLAMILNGTTNAVFTAADEVAEFMVPVTGDAFGFRFAFDGEGTADLYGFSARLGSVFTIR